MNTINMDDDITVLPVVENGDLPLMNEGEDYTTNFYISSTRPEGNTGSLHALNKAYNDLKLRYNEQKNKIDIMTRAIRDMESQRLVPRFNPSNYGAAYDEGEASSSSAASGVVTMDQHHPQLRASLGYAESLHRQMLRMSSNHEAKEREMERKYIDLYNKYKRQETEVENLQVKNRQYELQLKDLHEKCEKITAEFEAKDKDVQTLLAHMEQFKALEQSSGQDSSSSVAKKKDLEKGCMKVVNDQNAFIADLSKKIRQQNDIILQQTAMLKEIKAAREGKAASLQKISRKADGASMKYNPVENRHRVTDFSVVTDSATIPQQVSFNNPKVVENGAISQQGPYDSRMTDKSTAPIFSQATFNGQRMADSPATSNLRLPVQSRVRTKEPQESASQEEGLSDVNKMINATRISKVASNSDLQERLEANPDQEQVKQVINRIGNNISPQRTVFNYDQHENRYSQGSANMPLIHQQTGTFAVQASSPGLDYRPHQEQSEQNDRLTDDSNKEYFDCRYRLPTPGQESISRPVSETTGNRLTFPTENESVYSPRSPPQTINLHRSPRDLGSPNFTLKRGYDDRIFENRELMEMSGSRNTYQPSSSTGNEQREHRLADQYNYPDTQEHGHKDINNDYENIANFPLRTRESDYVNVNVNPSSGVVEDSALHHRPITDSSRTTQQSQICPICKNNYPEMSLSEFQLHAFDCVDNTESIEEENLQTLRNPLESGSRECPICSAIFPPELPQEEYERHVQEHFGDEANTFEIVS